MFGRKRKLDDFTSEIHAHLEHEIARLRERGLSEEEARTAARRQFGNVTRARERFYESRRWLWLDHLAQDIRYALRMLRKSPGFTAVAVLTLALGIGANTALFSIVNAVLLKPLPYPNPDRLVAVAESSPPFYEGSFSYPDFVDWAKMNHTFDALAAYRHGDVNLTGSGEAEHLILTEVSSSFFSLLGVQPVAGRDFTPDDDKPGATPTLMLSEHLWRGKFGASPEIIGKTLTLDGNAYTVIGIVPANVYFCCESMNFRLGDAYAPIGSIRADWISDRADNPGIFGVGRLKAGVSLSVARADMDKVARNLAVAYPATDKNSRVVLTSLADRMSRSVKRTLLILFAAVGFVLLIACANVANLLLARTTGRATEFALRAALGATRRRAIRQLLTESLLLAVTGGGLGVLLAWWGTHAGLKALPEALPRTNSIRMDPVVLSFTLAVSILGGLFFGLAPALKNSQPDLHDALKEGGRGSSGARHQRLQAVFVIAELALAAILLIGAGLMVRSLARVWRVDPGFNPHNVLAFDLSFPSGIAKQSPAQIRAYLGRLPDEIAKIPGVRAVTISDGAEPLDGDSELKFWVDGRPKPAVNQMPLTLSYMVSPDYLKVLRIPLLRGRFLSLSDTNPSQLVGVVDDVFARTYFPSQDPVGRYIHLGYKDIPIQIVGIVGHVKQWGLDETGRELNAQLYTLAAQLPDPWVQGLGSGASVVLRIDSPNSPTPDVLRAALAKVNSEEIAYDFMPMDSFVSQSLATRQFSAVLLACFAAAALLLAGIGIYGVMSYSVAQRMHEFGVRIALGAGVADLLKMVLAQGTKLTCAALALGLAAAFGLTQLIKSLLFGVTSRDPLTFAGVALILTVIALLACYIPARRATRVDPTVALRNE